MRLTLWEVTRAGINAVTDPYAEVSPYASCESAALLVVQEMVAPDAVMADEAVAETVRGAISDTLAVADEPFNVAETVTAWSASRAPAPAVKVAEVAPAATLTEDGTVNTEDALSDSVTAVLLVGDFVNVTVQVVLAFEARLAAAHCNEETIGRAVSESVAAWDEPLIVAVTVAA